MDGPWNDLGGDLAHERERVHASTSDNDGYFSPDQDQISISSQTVVASKIRGAVFFNRRDYKPERGAGMD
jgi:hypothetical protein